ncbi:MAG: low molecular weight protein arginine phosphatase [Candidatus Omnitrophota bacterium]|nr:low molecular weight protein arginine phosphatase [Candidatus Omnitrophota bacterium]
MAKIKSVLFVCTGNSCRSIMAEGLLREALKKLGKNDIIVSSAGVSAIDGFRPTRETIEVMKRDGLDVSGFRSKFLTDEMIINSDLILVMAAHHMDDIIGRIPEAASRTHMLKQYGKLDHSRASEDLDIYDPIGRSIEVYEEILGEIKKEIDRITRIL